MARRRVRVTQLAQPIEVNESEIPNLRGQGYLIEDDEAPASAQPEGAAAKDSGRQAGAKTTPPK